MGELDESLGPIELGVWMGAVHATSAAEFAQLLGRRVDTVRHWLGGTKTPAIELRVELEALSARIEVAAYAAIEAGAVYVVAGDAWQRAVAARALSITSSADRQSLDVVVVPGVWSITTPDGRGREFTGQTPALRSWITELLGHPPGRFRCTPSSADLPAGATARLVVDGLDYTLRRER